MLEKHKMQQEYKTHISKIEYIKDDVVMMTCDLDDPSEIEFEAGSFVMIKMPNPDGAPVSRLYSIASSPLRKNQVDFLIKIIPNGKCTSLIKYLSLGQNLSFFGPNGVFTLQDDDNDEIVFIATGVGIAPFVSMIEYLSQTNDPRKITLYWGLRFEDDIFFEDKFKKFDIGYHLHISQPNDNWVGIKGRVTDTIRNIESNNISGKSFYICGSKAMIDEVETILLEKGAEERHIYYEKFY